jgi:methionyl-tRNA formyltransferase
MKESLPIGPKDTAETLTEKLSMLGARLVVKALPLIESGALKPMLQNGTQATFAPILRKEDGLVNWALPATGIYNLVRGVTPWPGAYSFLDGGLIKILETEAVAGSGEPGRLYRGGEGALEAGTGNGRLRLLRVQPAGKKPMTAADFLRGHRGIEGKKFEARISKS